MMPMMTLDRALPWLSQARLVGRGDVLVQRVHTDTRTIEPGDLFIALKGERYDANAFLEEAHRRGAAAVVCHAGAPEASFPKGLVRIEVPDTLHALGQLACAWRAQFSIPLIAVTGSNGKTTVTQMVAAILRAYVGEDALATQGNLNNAIGVPLTLLRLRPTHRMAVVELGMNHPGEIAALAALAQPTVALVNNAQREHLEFMHTIDAVARENGSVLQALGADGTAVFPQDDSYAPLWQTLSGARQVRRFSAHAVPQAHVACQSAQWRNGAWQVQARALDARFDFSLHIAGRHNLANALAASACALAAGVPLEAIAKGLAQFVPVKGRSRVLCVTVDDVPRTVVDDTYNANPDSVRAAIDVLAELPGPRLLVLGDMGEVGAQGRAFHEEAGLYARARGIDHVLTTGALARYAHVAAATTAATTPATQYRHGAHFDDRQALLAAVLQTLPHVQSVLVKGSRFMQMEQVIEAMLPSGVLHAVH